MDVRLFIYHNDVLMICTLISKKCQNCGCTRHCHQDINYFKNLLSISSSQSPKDDKLSSEDKANLESKYSWYPKGVEHAIVSYLKI